MVVAFLPDEPRDMNRQDMIIDRVDSNDRVIGSIIRRQIFGVGANFRVVHVFLFNSHKQLLLQKIANTDTRYPGRWGSSVAGYLRAGEEYESAAYRKLHEELGVNSISLTFCGKTSMRDNNCHKFITIFAGVYDGPIRLNPQDAEEIAAHSIDKIEHDLQFSESWFTPTFIYVYDYFIRHIKNNLF